MDDDMDMENDDMDMEEEESSPVVEQEENVGDPASTSRPGSAKSTLSAAPSRPASSATRYHFEVDR